MVELDFGSSSAWVADCLGTYYTSRSRRAPRRVHEYLRAFFVFRTEVYRAPLDDLDLVSYLHHDVWPFGPSTQDLIDVLPIQLAYAEAVSFGASSDLLHHPRRLGPVVHLSKGRTLLPASLQSQRRGRTMEQAIVLLRSRMMDETFW